jgi:hypothetical protein
MGWSGMDWIAVSEDMDQWKALVSTVVNHWVSRNAGKFLNRCITGSLSRKVQLHVIS